MTEFTFEQNSVLDQKLVNSDTGEIYNIVSELQFSNNLDIALETHASKQVYWESIAIEVTRRVQEFEHIDYAKWMSHSRYYAKLALKGMREERILLDDIRDTVIRIYSKDTKDEDRDTYCRYAFHAHLCVLKGSIREAERFEKVAPIQYRKMWKEFKLEMLSYLEGDKVYYYETVTQVLYSLKEQAERIRAVAKAFDKRSYCMKEFTDLERSKFGNIGPLTVDEIVNEVTKKVSSKLGMLDQKSIMMETSQTGRR